MTIYKITVHGRPAPQGSKTRNRYGAVFESSKAVAPWREAIRAETQQVMTEPLGGAVIVLLTFFMARPKGHYRTGRYAGQLRPAAPHWHTSAPDLDKLTRAVLDGLTEGGAWKDDSQASMIIARKEYGPTPGCWIQLEEAET